MVSVTGDACGDGRDTVLPATIDRCQAPAGADHGVRGAGSQAVRDAAAAAAAHGRPAGIRGAGPLR